MTELPPWQTLLTLDKKSDDFTHLARRILSDQRHRKSEVSQFTKEQALNLVELIDSAVGLAPYSAVREV